jgi:putative colanic acid biosynthesis UDP-glucose lipid carrier transferase
MLRLHRQEFWSGGGPTRQNWISAARLANKESFLLAAAMFAIIYATKDKAISRQFIAIFLISTWLVLLLLNRKLPDLITRYLFHGNDRVRTILVGSAAKLKSLESWVQRQESIGLDVCGVVSFEDPNPEDGQTKVPFLGTVNSLDELIQRHNVQQMILLDNRNSRTWMDYVFDISMQRGCRLLIYNSWQEFSSRSMTAINEGGQSFFTLQDEPLQNPFNRILKRFLDMGIALPVVIFILPILCLWVKCMQLVQAPGPLLYRQERTGAERRPFIIYKFRTMHCRDEKDEQKQASKADARIYRFGNFLRRTSLDEFPQFINVLQGNMSVVGPRPHLIAHDESFARQLKVYRDRHFVKPGITGLAQNRGYRGEIRSIEEINNRIQLDLQYIHNWSIWLDLGIIIKTVWQIFRPPPSAY